MTERMREFYVKYFWERELYVTIKREEEVKRIYFVYGHNLLLIK